MADHIEWKKTQKTEYQKQMSKVSEKGDMNKLPSEEFESFHVSNLTKGAEGDHKILTKAHMSQLGSVQPIEALRMSAISKPDYIKRYHSDQLTKRSIDFQMLRTKVYQNRKSE